LPRCARPGARSAEGKAAAPEEARVIRSARRAWYFALGAAGVCLALVGAVLVFSALAGSPTPADSQAARPAAPTVVVSTTALGDNEAMICLLDTAQQRLAVYVADAKRSRLRLLAVRDISADMMLTDFNNDPPLPKDVRARMDKAVESARPAPAAEGRIPAAVP